MSAVTNIDLIRQALRTHTGLSVERRAEMVARLNRMEDALVQIGDPRTDLAAGLCHKIARDALREVEKDA